MASSIYPLPLAFNTVVAADADILSTPITISSEQVAPGGGGILRVYFSFTFTSDTATQIDVFGGSAGTTNKGALNADNNAVLVSKGYYRFDLDIEAGDIINFKPKTTAITNVAFFRAHLVVFGA